MNGLFLLKALGITLLVAFILFSLSLFDLWTQIARYRNYWERNNQSPALSNEILYVALGDSTAQGIGATHPGKSYPAIISRQLAERKDRPVRLVNLSKTGATIHDALDRQLPALRQMDINEQTVVTIEIGANDMVSFDAASFEAEMDELMERLPRQTVMSDIPYFGGGRLKSKQPNVAAANEIMYRLAGKHGFELVPLHAKLQQNSGLKTFAPDWFHPSNLSYRENWAPVFLEGINRHGK